MSDHTHNDHKGSEDPVDSHHEEGQEGDEGRVTDTERKSLTEEEQKRVAEAEKADREIRFLELEDVAAKTYEGVWVLFFGDRGCNFTPTWLQIQRDFDALMSPPHQKSLRQNSSIASSKEGSDHSKLVQKRKRRDTKRTDVRLAKVFCSNSKEDYCGFSSIPSFSTLDNAFCAMRHRVENFPTINFYVRGMYKGNITERTHDGIMKRLGEFRRAYGSGDAVGDEKWQVDDEKEAPKPTIEEKEEKGGGGIGQTEVSEDTGESTLTLEPESKRKDESNYKKEEESHSAKGDPESQTKEELDSTKKEELVSAVSAVPKETDKLKSEEKEISESKEKDDSDSQKMDGSESKEKNASKPKETEKSESKNGEDSDFKRKEESKLKNSEREMGKSSQPTSKDKAAMETVQLGTPMINQNHYTDATTPPTTPKRPSNFNSLDPPVPIEEGFKRIGLAWLAVLALVSIYVMVRRRVMRESGGKRYVSVRRTSGVVVGMGMGIGLDRRGSSAGVGKDS
ncbi:hypothetical protein HDU67_009250 [Dinochytrium kinnereticum]|nr:hypothetical protein HDU67_009250 [Dinochytrium kinnereticum]